MAHTVVVTYPALEAGKIQEGKFLQLRLNGKEYLVFASRDRHRFHNQILAHFLADQGVACHWTDNEELRIDESMLVIDGGGRFRLDAERQLLTLSDNSQAYGRFDDQRVRQGLALAQGDWSELKLSITQ